MKTTNLLLAAFVAVGLLFSACKVKKGNNTEYNYMHEMFDLIKAEFPDAHTKIDQNHVKFYFPHNDMFDVGSSVLKPAFEPRVTAFANLLNKYPETAMKIVGHTDNTGDEAKNVTLSEERALHVLESLRDHGVNANRLFSEGKGETTPIASNDTEAGRAENRRVEYEIYYTPK